MNEPRLISSDDWKRELANMRKRRAKSIAEMRKRIEATKAKK